MSRLRLGVIGTQILLWFFAFGIVALKIRSSRWSDETNRNFTIHFAALAHPNWIFISDFSSVPFARQLWKNSQLWSSWDASRFEGNFFEDSLTSRGNRGKFNFVKFLKFYAIFLQQIGHDFLKSKKHIALRAFFLSFIAKKLCFQQPRCTFAFAQGAEQELNAHALAEHSGFAPALKIFPALIFQPYGKNRGKNFRGSLNHIITRLSSSSLRSRGKACVITSLNSLS